MAATSTDPPGDSSLPAQRDGHAPGSPVLSRAESVTSDGISIASSITETMPAYVASVRPAPVYVSLASASQVATEVQDARSSRLSDDEDSHEQNGRVAVAEGAVTILNTFLDKLLHDFLSTARSTSLLVLKPAVAEVLRKGLARDAIARAENDLEDLLALQDSDDEEPVPHTPKETGKWSLEYIWKRSRLRVMMRSEKSDFDIEDDERHVQEEGLLQGRRFSQSSVISLYSEIFLAGVLDFVAEMLLSQAAIGAAVRSRRRGVNLKSGTGLQGMSHIVVQEPDVEKAALNSPAERLWRNWRKSMRSSGTRRYSSLPGSPAMTHPENLAANAVAEEFQPQIPDMDYPEHVLASNIPLPMSPRDVDEIEVPGLAKDPDEEVLQQDVTSVRFGHRPVKSFGDASYFAFMRSSTKAVQRPSSSPAPAATPFIDAPGAWPGETPDTEVMDATAEHAAGPATEHAARPATEPAVEPTTEPSVHPTVEPSTKSITELAIEPTTESAAEPTTEPVTEPITESSIEPTTESAAEPTTEPVTEPITESAVEPTIQSAAEPITELINTAISGTPSTPETAVLLQQEVEKSDELLHASPSNTLITQVDPSPLPTSDPSQLKLDPMQAGTGLPPSTTATVPAVGESDLKQESTSSLARIAIAPSVAAAGAAGGAIVANRSGRTHGKVTPEDAKQEPVKVVESAVPATNIPEQNNNMPRQIRPDATTFSESISQQTRNLPTAAASAIEALPRRVSVRRDYAESPVLPNFPSHGQAHEPTLTALPETVNTKPVIRERTQLQSHASPRIFVVGKSSPKLSSQITDSPREQLKSPNDPLAQESSFPTASESSSITKAPQSPSNETPKGLQGLGISPVSPDDAKVVRAESPVFQQRGSDDIVRTRRTSKITETDLSTPNSRRSSLKVVASDRTTSMDETTRTTNIGKLTSASITSAEDFDMMLQSKDTVKYTLTPESVRDLPQPKFSSSAKTNTRSKLNGSRESISSLVGKKSSPPRIDTDLEGPRPSRSIVASPTASSRATTATLPKDKMNKIVKSRAASISRPEPKNAKPSSFGHLPREPTVQTQSTRDFADFIRTTGPYKEQNSTKPLLSSRSAHSLRSAVGSNDNSIAQSPNSERSRSASTSQASTPRPAASDSVPPVPPMPASVGASLSSGMNDSPRSPALSTIQSRATLRPRGADGSSSAVSNSSDLIDFIRNGPPDQKNNRIPRNVAPFSVDSDIMGSTGDHLGASKTPDSSYSGSSTIINGNAGTSSYHRSGTSIIASVSDQAPSTRSSTNSQSRLLPSGNTHTAELNSFSRLNAPAKPPPDFVERKRHRNKDPYHIDDSEDDDLLTALPRDQRPEMSLIEFLRNAEPPVNNAPKPLAVAGPAQARALMNKARTNSVNSLRTSGAISDSKSNAVSADPASLTSSPSLNTTQTSMSSQRNYSTAAPTSSIASNSTVQPANTTSALSPSGIPRNPNRPRMEVKAAGATHTNSRHKTATGDLADFLRNSGPPEPVKRFDVDSAPSPTVGMNGGKVKKSARFWKRKTSVDMA